MSRAQALWELGWVKPVDIFMVLADLLGLCLIGAWYGFGSPSAVNVLCVLFACILVNQWWIVMLLFRATDFILSIRGEINLLPAAAARIVAASIQGR